MSRKWNYVEIPIRCFKSKNVSFLITWESRLFLSIRKHSDWRLSKNHISEWVSLSFLFWPALFSWNYLTCPQTFSQSSFKRWSWHCLKSQDKLEDKWWEYDDIWVVHGGKISILGEYLLACLFWQQTWFVNRDSNLLWAGFFISVIGCVLPLFVSILCCWMGVTYWRYQNQGDSHPPRLTEFISKTDQGWLTELKITEMQPFIDLEWHFESRTWFLIQGGISEKDSKRNFDIYLWIQLIDLFSINNHCPNGCNAV